MPARINGLHFGRLLTAVSATACMGVGAFVHAQETQAPGFEEEVVVTGFRQSLKTALDAKRNATNVIDGIAAEDIGKSADQNIAEALQRVTGISISRQNGEGTTVTIRGTSADLNQVTLNGVPLTSSGENQSVNFSEFSSDILSSIEVIKTPSADHDEGSLGASVRLKSFKPLDSKKNKRSLEVQGRTNTLANNNEIDLKGADHKISLAFSEKLLDSRLGLSFVASQETNSGRQDEWDAQWWRALVGSNDPNRNEIFQGGVTNIRTGEIVNGYDYDGDGTISDSEKRIIARQPQQVQYRYELNKRDRDSYTTTFQFLPTDRTDVQLDLTYTRQYIERDVNYISTTPDQSNKLAGEVFWDPETYDIVRNVRSATYDGITVGTVNRDRNPGVVRVHRDISGTVQTNKVVGLEIEHVQGDFTFTLSGGRSTSISDDDKFFQGRFGSLSRGNVLRSSGLQNGFICDDNSSNICYLYASARPNDPDGNTAIWFDRPEFFQFNLINLRDRYVEDSGDNVFFDVDWDTKFGPITSIEAGIKWSSRVKDLRSTTDQFDAEELGAESTFNGQTLAQYATGQSTAPDWGEGLGFRRDQITDGWVQIDVEKLAEAAVSGTLSQQLGVSLRPEADGRDTRHIEQDVRGAYIMANFDFFDRITGDVGVRYVETELFSWGYTGFNYSDINFFNDANIAELGSIDAIRAAYGENTEPGNKNGDPADYYLEAEHSYNNVLPSLNLNFLLADDLILRFAASKTIARPRLDDLKPGFTVNENPFSSFSTATAGNPYLNPYKSTNLDLSLEWYFAEGSLLSATLFNKDIEDFAEESNVLYHLRDIRSEFYDGPNLRPASDVTYVPDLENLLLSISNSVDNEQPNCMPSRESDASSPRGPTGCEIVSLKQSRNGKGGYVRGAELTFQHNFTYLPSILGDTGVSANYTYSDSLAEAEFEPGANGVLQQVFPESPFLQTSEHTVNATLFWERDNHLIRLAYNSRSDFLRSRAERDGTAAWVEGFDTLDLSATMKVNKYLSLNFQAINLTDTVTREYNTSISADSGLPVESATLGDQPTHRTSNLINTGTTYRLGARMTF